MEWRGKHIHVRIDFKPLSFLNSLQLVQSCSVWTITSTGKMEHITRDLFQPIVSFVWDHCTLSCFIHFRNRVEQHHYFFRDLIHTIEVAAFWVMFSFGTAVFRRWNKLLDHIILNLQQIRKIYYTVAKYQKTDQYSINITFNKYL